MKISKMTQVKSYLLLIGILFQTIYPSTAFAIADSPAQVEYQSYEDFNSSDMVNLITGDFTYNIPLLNIPSPEGGYQVPLTYHAGIELNEESSWVGLGWNLNAGALTRNVSMYPDDFTGEDIQTTVTNPGGNGYIKSYPVYTKYYDSKKGDGGSVNLMGIVDVGWKSQKHVGISPLGLTIKDGKASYDVDYMLEGLKNTGLLALDIWGGPVGSAVSTAVSTASSVKALSAQSNQLSSVSKMGNWTQEQHYTKGIAGIWGNKVSYKYYVNTTISNAQFGVLYLGDMEIKHLTSTTDDNNNYIFNNAYSASDIPKTGNQSNSVRVFDSPTTNSGLPSSDMYLKYTTAAYNDQFAPTSLSYDNFDVKASGVSGNITPYRLEIGSLVTSALSSAYCRYNVGPRYLSSAEYKVPFRYVGDYSNSYNFQKTGANIEVCDTLFTLVPSSDAKKLYVWNNSSKTYASYPASNGVSAYGPITNNAAQALESNRTGLYNRKLVHEKHIDWFSNWDISHSLATGFMDYHDANTTSYSRAALPLKGIGGFCVTNESGITYHFALPVYNKGDYTYSKDNASGTDYVISNPYSYATTWLLTGITGPDFIDRNANGKIDDTDWGYWVKFEYGKFANNYVWRNPYYAYEKSGDVMTYQKGTKDTYYLNRISTRTHSALFVKSAKVDGKSYHNSYQNSIFGTESSGSINTNPSSSLKLNEIYVLENSDYQKLISTASGDPGLTYVNTTSQNNTVKNGDTFDNVLDSMDIIANSSIQSFLTANQLQKIHFNYNYQLCKNTFNSFPFTGGATPSNDPNYAPSSGTRFGKLTLKSLELYGKNNSKLLPGYSFKYGDETNSNYESVTGDNPAYSPHKYDWYGMYKSGGTNYSDYPHTAEIKANQWCLSDIVTPLGSTVSVEYERDDFQNINGIETENASLHLKLVTGTKIYNTFELDHDNFGSNSSLSDLVKQGDLVNIAPWFQGASGPTQVNAQITSINGTYLTLGGYWPINTIWNADYLSVVTTKKRYGGGIRVKEIKTTDENNNSYSTKYIYTKDGLETGRSSGVASYDPDKGDYTTADFSFMDLYDHPYSPILYSNVTVINGKSTTTFKETSKQTYHFITPHKSMISHTGNFKPVSTGKYYKYNTVDRTSAIGSLDTMKTYNQFGNVVSKTVFEYTDNSNGYYSNNPGNYSETTVFWESFFMSSSIFPRIVQSYKLKRPNLLKSVTTYKDRLVSKQEIVSYDYLTGKPLVTTNTYGGQEKYESSIVPAYTKYSSLSSKVYNVSNKNIMSAPAEIYSYVYDKNNQKKLLGASVMTWSNTNTFREYNSTSGLYEDQVNTNYWLPSQTYNYKTRVDENGTINNTDFIDFNWSGGIDPRWIKTSEVSVYDHYSNPLQVIDMNGNASSVKYGYNSSYPIASCENSLYKSWCFSGAEDVSLVTNYFEGEVKGSNTQFASTTYAHTGNYCCKIGAGQTGFSYRVKRNDLPSSGKYRASVWIHQNGVQAAYLDCKCYNSTGTYLWNGGAAFYGLLNSTSTFNATVEQAGNWYLFNIDVDLSAFPPSTDYLIFNVDNGSSNGYAPYIYADDFKVCPLSNPIVANVYDKKTGKVVATLDKENYAMKYFYDDAGKLKSVYKETKNGFNKISQTTYNYAK